jgi:hypothetical protein
MLELPSRISDVAVFRRGAVVTRTVDLRAEGGRFPDRVALVGLPLSLDDSSIGIEVVTDGEGAAPVAGDVQITVSVPAEDPRLPPPDDAELQAAELAHARARRRVDDLGRTLARVEAIAIVPRGQPEEGKPPAASPTAPRLELLAFRRRRSTALHEQLLDARARLHEAEERVATLHERKRVASSARNVAKWEIRKAAIVRLESREDSASRVTLRLRYFVPGARWTPAYTIRLDRALRSGTIELRALVGQATGEDWRGVALTLSTATPQRWTELPELRALRIGRAQPEPAKTGWRPPPSGTDELYADYDRDLRRPPVAKPEPMPAMAPAPAMDLREQAQGYAAPGFGPPPPAGPPPPPPMRAAAPMAPPPQAMPMPLSAPRSKSAGIGSLIGGVASMFSSEDTGTGRLADMDMRDEPAAAPTLLAGPDLLDYGRLQLPGPDAPQRGVLQRVDTRILYRYVQLTTVSIDVAFRHIESAAEDARRLESRPTPPRHCDPESEAGFDYAWVADAPIDLDSDGRFHAVPVLAATAEASPRFVSVPRETQDVFRIVALRNPLAAPILPGPADVYVDGRFFLTSDLELVPQGGRVELGLGVEQSIKIARNVEFAEDTSGLIKRQHDLVHTIAIEIANHLAQPAEVEIRERMPVTHVRDESIKIEERHVEPPWEDWEPKREELEGGKRWRVEVPAGGRKELRATWVVSIPSGYELHGGNRREA